MPEFDEDGKPASLDEIDERIDHGEFWTQFASNLGFESPAAARDEHDREGWRETERARIRCLDLMEHPPRRRSPTLGVFGPTEVRQVNVKLDDGRLRGASGARGRGGRATDDDGADAPADRGEAGDQRTARLTGSLTAAVAAARRCRRRNPRE